MTVYFLRAFSNTPKTFIMRVLYAEILCRLDFLELPWRF